MKEEEKIALSKKMIMVRMDDANTTTSEKPIIGTQALATCFGILVIDKKAKKAIIAHVSSTWQPAIIKLLKLLDFHHSHIYNYKIFPGYYSEQEDHYHVEQDLEKFFMSIGSTDIQFVPFLNKDIPSNAIILDEATLSYEFAYDASICKFVTDRVLFGNDYLNANSEKIK